MEAHHKEGEIRKDQYWIARRSLLPRLTIALRLENAFPISISVVIQSIVPFTPPALFFDGYCLYHSERRWDICIPTPNYKGDILYYGHFSVYFLAFLILVIPIGIYDFFSPRLKLPLKSKWTLLQSTCLSLPKYIRFSEVDNCTNPIDE